MNQTHDGAEPKSDPEPADADTPPQRAAQAAPPTRAGKPREAKSPKAPRLTIPSQETFDEIAADFKLSEVQATHLADFVKHALADTVLYQFVRSRDADHKEQVRDLIELEKRLGALVSLLEGKADLLKAILPTAVLDELGELFSFTGIGRALGKDVFPDDPDLLMDYLKEQELLFGIAAADAFYAQKLANFGLLQGNDLFLYVLRLVHAPLRAWLAAKAADTGGRPRSAERRFLIERLTNAAPKILGAPPSRSITSPFVGLCERVLSACGFAEKGIDKAVMSVLSKRWRTSTTPKEPGTPKL